MVKNPYKYIGPLDPVKDKNILVPRNDVLDRVIHGIKEGDFWVIFGPRQIGKTTFLRQLRYRLRSEYVIYVNLEVSPTSEAHFYQWLMETVIENIPAEPIQDFNDKWHDEPELKFFEFLKHFCPKDSNKRIILIFDEFGGVAYPKPFLHIWRKVYHDRSYNKNLARYSVVISGNSDFMFLSREKTSPFNIAKCLYMKGFSQGESERLIDVTFENLDIKIEPAAKMKLIFHISGHPQMLQHACFYLVNIAMKKGHVITEKDVDEAIDRLLNESSNIKLLKSGIWDSQVLEILVKDILKGKKIPFGPYEEYSIIGAGCIVREDSHCKIRNKVYERVLKELLSIPRNKRGYSTEYDYVNQSSRKISKVKEFTVVKSKNSKREEEEIMNRFVAIKSLKRLYLQGLAFLHMEQKSFNVEHFKGWLLKVGHILDKAFKQESFLSEEFKKIFEKEIKSKEIQTIVNDTLSIISTAIESKLLDTSETEIKELEGDMLSVISRKFFKSPFVVFPIAIFLFTIVFATIGVIQINDTRIDIKKLAEDALNKTKEELNQTTSGVIADIKQSGQDSKTKIEKAGGSIEKEINNFYGTKKQKIENETSVKINEIKEHGKASKDKIEELKNVIENEIKKTFAAKKKEIEKEFSGKIDEIKKNIAPTINSKISEKIAQLAVLEYKITEIKKVLEKEQIKNISKIKEILERFQSDFDKNKIEQISNLLAFSKTFIWLLITISGLSFLTSIILLLIMWRGKKKRNGDRRKAPIKIGRR